jgi:hypothetical protein
MCMRPLDKLNLASYAIYPWPEHARARAQEAPARTPASTRELELSRFSPIRYDIRVKFSFLCSSTVTIRYSSVVRVLCCCGRTLLRYGTRGTCVFFAASRYRKTLVLGVDLLYPTVSERLVRHLLPHATVKSLLLESKHRYPTVSKWDISHLLPHAAVKSSFLWSTTVTVRHPSGLCVLCCFGLSMLRYGVLAQGK